MEIRICSKTDIDELVKLSVQSYVDHYTYLWYDNGEAYIKSNFSYQQLNAELADPNASFYMICLDNRPVGYLKLNIDKGIENYSPTDALELERIYFIKEAAGKGLGRSAMEFVVDLAKSKNKTIVWLKSMDSSKAVDFYKKHNFLVCNDYLLTFPTMKHEFKKILVMCREI